MAWWCDLIGKLAIPSSLRVLRVEKYTTYM
jgi:hypothetical protein